MKANKRSLAEKITSKNLTLKPQDNIRLATPGKIGYRESSFVDHSTKQSMDIHCYPKVFPEYFEQYFDRRLSIAFYFPCFSYFEILIIDEI